MDVSLLDRTFEGFIGLVYLGLIVLNLAVKVWALALALRAPAPHFTAAGKWKKSWWLAILGFALAVNVVVWYAPINILNLAGLVAAAVFLADVRPALAQVRGGGGSSSGPYGGW